MRLSVHSLHVYAFVYSSCVVHMALATSEKTAVLRRKPRVVKEAGQFRGLGHKSPPREGVVSWPWGRTYCSILGWTNIHVPHILRFTRSKYRVFTHSQLLNGFRDGYTRNTEQAARCQRPWLTVSSYSTGSSRNTNAQTFNYADF